MVMNRFGAFFSGFFFLSAISSPLHAGLSDWFSSLSPEAEKAKQTLEGLDATVEKALQDYEVPGIAVGIVVDGQLIYAKGFGFRDLETKKPVTPNTLFAIGSCTKAFTSFLAGMLIDEGLFDWDSFVCDLLPDFRLYDSYATHHMTLRDLLTHRSGMPRHDFMWYNGTLTRSQLMQRLRYLEPASELRERFQYNNLMYMTAGYAMEQLTKKSWEDLVAEKIFKPLEMSSSNLFIEDMQKSADYASPYLQKEEGLVRIGLRDNSVIGPAASINSNIQDLAHWIQLHLGQGVYNNTRLINLSTLQEMHSPQVVVSGTPEHKEAVLSTHGIGWGVLSYRGRYQVSHDGGSDGFTSVISLLPDEKIGVVILCNKNLTTLPRFLSAEIIDRLLRLPPINWYQEGLDAYLKSKDSLKQLKLQEDITRKKGTHPSHPLDDYVGQYQHPGYGEVDIARNGDQLQLTFNRITSSLNHWHYDVFVVSEESEDLHVSRIGTKLSFHMNLNGEIDELIIPFEPGTSDVVFTKKPSNELESLSYLQQFAGLYQIYGVTVEILVKDQHLVANIPGQPVYELIPNAVNEFTVKSKIGQTVRFVLDAMNQVEEVLLIQPYGAFSAKPKK